MSPINVSAASSSIDVTAGESIVEIEVSAGQVDVDVIGGQGPQGPTGPQGPPGEGGASSWNDLEDIPADFPPQAHTHTAGDIDTESAAAGYVLTANGEGGATWEEASGGGASSWNELTDKPAALDGGYFAIDDDGFLCLRSLDLSNPIKIQTNAGLYGGLYLYSIDFYDPATDSFTTQTTAWTGTVAAEDVTGLATVATSGSYDDLDNLPTLFDGAYSSLTGTPTLGTAAAAATTDFAAASHNQAWSTITSTPTTLAGYGITDAASSSHTHAQLHDRSHAITSSSDHTATAWRVFYANGSGVVTELALGNIGQALISQGASAAPTWGSAGSTSASDLSSGTLANARMTTRARAAMNLYLWSSFR